MWVFIERQWVDKGNRLLVFCVWAETQRRREGANTAVRMGVILQPRDQRWLTLPVPITAVILLSPSFLHSPSPSLECNTGSSLGGRVHPLFAQTTKLAWHHSSSSRSLHLYWISFCVGLDYCPWHPEGSCHYNWTAARPGHAHMATLSGAIMPPGPLSGFIFSPSSSKNEVKERPCLKCFEWPCNGDMLNVFPLMFACPREGAL